MGGAIELGRVNTEEEVEEDSAGQGIRVGLVDAVANLSNYWSRERDSKQTPTADHGLWF